MKFNTSTQSLITMIIFLLLTVLPLNAAFGTERHPCDGRAANRSALFVMDTDSAETSCARSAIQTADGGFLMVGFTDKYNGSTDYDIVVNKFDSDGNLIWNRVVRGTSTPNMAYDVVETADQSLIISGATVSYGMGGNDIIILKYNRVGDLLWAKTAGDSGDEYGLSITLAADESFFISGLTTGYGVSGTDVLLLKFDDTGSLLWSRTAGGGADDRAMACAATMDNGVVISGYTYSWTYGYRDCLTMKFNSSGTHQWTATAGSSGTDRLYGVDITADGGCIAVGESRGFGPGTSSSSLLIKYSSTGGVQWARITGTSEDQLGYSVSETPGGDYITTGLSFPGHTGLFMYKYDESGPLIWSHELRQSSGAFWGWSVDMVQDGGYVFSGEHNSWQVLVRTDSDGWIQDCDAIQDVTVTDQDITASLQTQSPAPSVASPSVTVLDITGILMQSSYVPVTSQICLQTHTPGPTYIPTETPTVTSTPTETSTPTITPTSTITPMPTLTATPTVTPEHSATPTPTATGTPANTSTPSPTGPPTETPVPPPVPVSSPAGTIFLILCISGVLLLNLKK